MQLFTPALAFRLALTEEKGMLMSAAFLFSALVQFGLGLLMAAMLGPEEFGRYAIAFAAAVIGQTLFFEWIRLSITRFQGGGARIGQRLGRLAIGTALLLCALAGFVWMSGGEQRPILVAIILSAVIWGLSECRGAELRAQFAERLFALFLLLRSGAALIAMPVAAWWDPRGEIVLGAFAVSTLLALLAHRLIARPPQPATAGSGKAGDAPPLRSLVDYASPIIATNLAYLLLFFALRLFIASKLGIGEAGAFSLAFDLGMKLVMTLGTALDLYLFQLAVRAEHRGGTEEGRRQVVANLRLIAAILAPAMLGLALVLPSLELLLIAPAFRMSFDGYLLGLLPGFLLFGLVQYAIHPAHQLEQRTFPLVIAAASAMAAAFTILMIGGVTRLLMDQIPALALGVGMAAAAAVLWLTLPVPLPVEWRRFLPRIGVALAGMAAVVIGLRFAIEPGWIGLLTGMAGGLGAYLALAWLTNLADCRGFLESRRKNAT